MIGSLLLTRIRCNFSGMSLSLIVGLTIGTFMGFVLPTQKWGGYEMESRGTMNSFWAGLAVAIPSGLLSRRILISLPRSGSCFQCNFVEFVINNGRTRHRCRAAASACKFGFEYLVWIGRFGSRPSFLLLIIRFFIQMSCITTELRKEKNYSLLLCGVF